MGSGEEEKNNGGKKENKELRQRSLAFLFPGQHAFPWQASSTKSFPTSCISQLTTTVSTNKLIFWTWAWRERNLKFTAGSKVLMGFTNVYKSFIPVFWSHFFVPQAHTVETVTLDLPKLPLKPGFRVYRSSPLLALCPCSCGARKDCSKPRQKDLTPLTPHFIGHRVVMLLLIWKDIFQGPKKWFVAWWQRHAVEVWTEQKISDWIGPPFCEKVA